jgi:hypothetical protein
MADLPPEQLAERAADEVIAALGALARPFLLRQLRRTFGAPAEDGESDEAIERRAEAWAGRYLSRQKRPQRERRKQTKRRA